MSKHDGATRGFMHLSEAWYGRACLTGEVVDRITMGFYHKGGGTTGEFTMEWEPLGRDLPARLMVFDDGWHALYEFRDVLAEMAKLDGTSPSAAEICALLIKCGVEDMTERTDPIRYAPDTRKALGASDE